MKIYECLRLQLTFPAVKSEASQYLMYACMQLTSLSHISKNRGLLGCAVETFYDCWSSVG